jgi:phytoene desaturase
MKKVIIIGAGPGGLTSGLILAKNGYDVRIYEKQNYVGGRNSEIKLGDYHFDMGPTFFLMKDYIEEIFKKVGLNLHDFIELQKIEPMYRLYFNENTIFYPYNDKEKMLKEIKRVFPGEENGYLKYLEKEQKKYERLIGCLQIPYSKISDFFKKQFIKALPFLDAHVSLYDVLGRYFNNEFLKLSFTFQAKYIGMSPFEAPGTFSIISYLEHAFGIYHIKGGLNKINHAMADIIKENNGKIYLNNGVKELIIENGEAKGVLLENGEKDFADYVIINADFAHAMTHIVNKKDIQKYKKEKLDKKTYSCSTFMLYLGVNKVYDNIPHHSILFSGDYRKNVKEITTTLQLSDDPSIYVQNASITDDTLAPKGKSTIYILVPVPNNFSNIDWEKEKFKFREKVLDLVEKRGGFSDLRNHIEEKLMFTPKEWEEKIYVYKGATFNLGHNISQMLIFRPHNEFEEFKNCYLVGGGTHPGSGLPTIYESARISTDLILKRDKVK